MSNAMLLLALILVGASQARRAEFGQFPFPISPLPFDPSEILNITDLSEQCLTDFNRFTSSLNTYVQTFRACQQAGGCTKEQQTVLDEHIFAIKQIDAFGKIPAGLLRYTLTNTGSYAECIDLVAPYKAQYCYVSAIMGAGGIPGGGIGPKLAVCMPASCSEADITKIMNIIDIRQYVPVNLTAPATNCVPLKNTYSVNFWVFICVMAFFAIWAMLATITDYILVTHYKDKFQGTGMRVFLTYSMYTNGSELMNVSPYKKGTIKSLASIRFLSMTWVVAGHVLMDAQASDTLGSLLEIWNPFLSTTILNAFFSVDTFFLLSGILVSYLFFKSKPTAAYVRNPKVWIMYYVHRYVRLTPPIMVFVWFYVTLAPLINGPWAISAGGTMIGYEACETYWWHNILYINNFFDMTQNCYGITWYLAVDTQLYLVAPVFLITLYISWIAGYALICLCIAASIAYVYYLTISHAFPAVMMTAFAINDPENGLKITDFFDLYYQKPWSRCTPYLVGIAVGYFLASGKKPKLNILSIVSLWLLAAATALASLYGPHQYIKGENYWSSAVMIWAEDRFLLELASAVIQIVLLSAYVPVFKWNNVVSGTYNNFSRIGWSLAVSWVIIANHLGWGGIIAEFMDHLMWQPLGRLSYSGYIVHFFLITYIFNLDDRPSHFVSIWRSYIYAGIPTVVVSYVFAFFWSCFFEVPIIKLEKMLTANLIPKKSSSKQAGTEITKEKISSPEKQHL